MKFCTNFHSENLVFMAQDILKKLSLKWASRNTIDYFCTRYVLRNYDFILSILIIFWGCKCFCWNERNINACVDRILKMKIVILFIVIIAIWTETIVQGSTIQGFPCLIIIKSGINICIIVFVVLYRVAH